MATLTRHSRKPLCLATLLAISHLAFNVQAGDSLTYDGGSDPSHVRDDHLLLTPVSVAGAYGWHTTGKGHSGLSLKTDLDLKGPHDDFHLTVTTLEGIDSAIFTVMSQDYSAKNGIDSGVTNSSLTIKLDNKGGSRGEFAGGTYVARGDQISADSIQFANVAAAAVQTGQAIDNSVWIENSDIDHTATSRLLIIHTATVDQLYSDAPEAAVSGNSLTIQNSELISKNDKGFKNIQLGAAYISSFDTDVLGADTNPVAKNNTLSITNSTVDAQYIQTVSTSGAYNKAFAAPNNRLNIENSTINTGALYSHSEGVYGIRNARIYTTVGFEDANDNVLSIGKTTITHDLGFNLSQKDTARYLSIATVNGTEHAARNTLLLQDVTISMINTPAGTRSNGPSLLVDMTTGAFPWDKDAGLYISAAAANVNNGWTKDPLLDSNVVRIKNSTLNLETKTSIHGGAVVRLSEGQGTDETSVGVVNNRVEISESTFGDVSIYGGAVSDMFTDNDPEVEVKENYVGLTNVTAKNVNIYGAIIDETSNEKAINNTVEIIGGTFETLNLTGGSVKNTEGGSVANNNKISVSGDVKIGEGSIYGGYLQDATTEGQATGNEINLAHNGTLILKDLYGGYSNNKGTAYENTWTENTLNLKSGNVTTENLNGFQNYNFYLTQDAVNSNPLIEVTGGESVLLVGGEQGSKIGLGILGDFSMQANDKVTLIKAGTGFVNEAGGKWQAGTDLSGMFTSLTVTNVPSLVRVQTREFELGEDYELKIDDSDENSLILGKGDGDNPPPTPGGSDSINDQTNTLVESSLSALATFFAADDLFVDTVLRSRDGKRDGLFAAARAGMYSYDTNTRLETNIVSGLVGFSASVGESDVGAFLEMGHASYDSRLNSLFGEVRGQGSHNYAGLGAFVNYALPAEGWRLTGYVKGGSLSNDFRANIVGADAGYDTDSFYWGAHLGTHYDVDAANVRTRIFLSYFYDGRESESYDIAGTDQVGGAHIKYDSLNAHRVQVGSLVEFKLSNTLRPYLGLTLEQTISAKAKGTATDNLGTMKLNTSDLEGSTGIFSAGWTYMNEPGTFSCEFGINGYGGTRNGLSGQLQGNWKF